MSLHELKWLATPPRKSLPGREKCSFTSRIWFKHQSHWSIKMLPQEQIQIAAERLIYLLCSNLYPPVAWLHPGAPKSNSPPGTSGFVGESLHVRAKWLVWIEFAAKISLSVKEVPKKNGFQASYQSICPSHLTRNILSSKRMQKCAKAETNQSTIIQNYYISHPNLVES